MGIIVVNAVAALLLVISLLKDWKKTVHGLMVGIGVLKGMLPLVAVIIIVIGLVLGFVPEHFLSTVMGGRSGILGIAVAAIMGSFLAVPAVAIFPLAASMLRLAGAQAGFMAIATMACFITTNSMVASISYPIEVNIMGSRAATIRLTLSFIAALCISLAMGVILNGYQL